MNPLYREELRTGEEWNKLYPIEILDLDGWTPRSEFETKLITKEDFAYRITFCTVRFPFPKNFSDEFRL